MVDVAVDRRVKRTRVLLRDAVLALAETHDLTALTVQDITRRADVNRATFYQHYRDKDELIEQTIDALLDDLFSGCAPVQAGLERLEPDVVHPSVVEMFREVGRRAGLYRRLIGHGGSAYFIGRFQSRNETLFINAWRFFAVPEDDVRIPTPVRARFAASASLGLIGYWLERDQIESPETMAAWLWRLTRPAWFDAVGVDSTV